jgi:hypothetical protein
MENKTNIRQFPARTNTVRRGKIEWLASGVRANLDLAKVKISSDPPKISVGKIFKPPSAGFGVK